MIKSMTGFGAAVHDTDTHSLQAELKTLNSKFLDLSLKLPKELSHLEYEIREIITRGLVRGKVVFNLEMETKEGVQGVTYNAGAVRNLFNELKGIAKDHEVSDSDIFGSIMRMPEVMQQSAGVLSEKDEQGILKMAGSAVHKCNEFRTQEGKSLQTALEDSIEAIRQKQSAIKKLEPARTVVIKQRISDNLNELFDSDKVDTNRFEQEMIYYLEKLDINEELVRLDNHLKYFDETLANSESQGKKLGFISQEIGREINTIGSKANDAGIQRLVVEMKDELEKIKEQVLNVI